MHEPLSVRIKITRTRAVIAVICLALAACGAAVATDNPQTIEVRAQDAISAHYDAVQPIPVTSGRSQIRQNLIELENAQIEGVQTTTFECASMGGCDPTHPPIKSCPSIGSPIPVTDQLTNPEQMIRDNSQPLNNGGGNVTIGQMDPNGIYSGAGNGTYVLCITAGGAVTPSYWEGEVQVEFAPAVWERGKGIVDVGPPSFKFTH